MSIIEILSAPPGSLVYHLITLFAIQAVLGMALDEWLRHKQPEYRRLVFAFGLLFLTRLLLMMVALVTWQGFLLSQGILPPLERFLDLVSLLLILYTVSLRQARVAGINRLFCVINLILASIVYGVLAPLWYSSLGRSPSLHYNGSWQEWVWAIWQILVLIWALCIFIRYGVRQKSLFVSIFSIFLFGHVMQLMIPQTAPHVAGWERLANLIVYPLFAVATYRSIVEELLASRTQEVAEEAKRQEAVQPGEDQNAFAFETAQCVFGSLDMPLVLERATQSVIEVLDVDLVAVIIRQAASSQNLEIVAVRHRDGLYETDRGQVDLLNLSTLRGVLQRKKQILLEAESDDSREWQEFLEQVGASPEQSLMVEPLVTGETSIGILVIGDSSLQRLSSVENSRSSHILAQIVASAIGNALLHRVMATQIDDLDKELQELAVKEANMAVADEPVYATRANGELAEQLEVELLQVQLELERARREIQEQPAGSDAELVKHFQEELSQTQLDLGRARRELLEEAGRLDIELVEHLQSELAQARFDLEQMREDMRKAEETILAQEGELIKRTQHIDQLSVFQAQHQEARMSLNLVRGYTDLLLGESLGVLEESQVKFLQRIKSSIERMWNVLGNLDTLTEIDLGELQLEPADVNVRLMIDNVVMQFKAQLEEKQIDLVVDIPSNLPPVRADAPKLEQIVSNLLNNALRCSPPASEIEVSARIQSADDKKHLMEAPFLAVSVRDAGGGIESEDPSQVFDRSGGTVQRAIGGLGEKGAGLAVAKNLVEAHRGHIWFDSEVGHGTTFTFTLPLNDATPSDVSKLTHEEAQYP